MLRKFFPLDKNYLLEEAQLLLKDQLLYHLFDRVKQAYEQQQNPLGLQDRFSLQIKNYKLLNLEPLEEFYYQLAGVYRFKWGDSQLEFVWDGRDHLDKYKEDWSKFFHNSIERFCEQDLFVQAVLDITVFLPNQRHPEQQVSSMATRMQQFMMQQFHVKLHKSKGLVNLKVA
ncbi:MAG: hypothetical protein ACK514_05995 [Bacteroidota bacterium]|nr:hypothetical protein [Cytophagales bacterium]MCE2955940.1 hypothetical protein [Flammeovirgaceae bacterium]MCZ8070357.1 hypothetical protein [Cytophagales bacterium]